MPDTKKSRTPGRRAPLPKPNEPLPCMWKLVAVMAIACGIGLFLCAGFSDWRVTGETSVNWYDFKSNFRSIPYNPTKYGLYNIAFNGGTTFEPWYQKKARICGGIDTYAPIGSAIGVFLNSPCPAGCVYHLRTRCQVYNTLTTYGYIALGSCLIVGLLSLVGAGWTLLYGVSTILLQIFWMGGGIANSVAIAWWLYGSDAGFRQLALQSQYPYANIGLACMGALACSFLLFALGLIVTASNSLKDCGLWSYSKPEDLDGVPLYGGTDDFRGAGGMSPFGPGASPGYAFGAPSTFRPPHPGYGGPPVQQGWGPARGFSPFETEGRPFPGATQFSPVGQGQPMWGRTSAPPFGRSPPPPLLPRAGFPVFGRGRGR